MTLRYGDVLTWGSTTWTVMYIGHGFEDNEVFQTIVVKDVPGWAEVAGNLQQYDTEDLGHWRLIEFER